MATVGTEVTHGGQGTLSYNSGTGAITRTMPDGRAYTVNPTDAKYASIYNEYVGGQTAAGQNAQAGYGQLSGYGTGQMNYDRNTGAVTRTLNGNTYQVNKGDPKYNAAYSEYVDRYGDPTSPAANEGPLNPVRTDTSPYEAMYYDLLNKMANAQYNPVDVKAEAANHMSYEEAVDMARKILEPQYQQKYADAASAAEQRLDRSGLYNSAYGQQLMANSQNAVSRDLEAAIGNLGQQLMEMDYNKAIEIAKLMQNENQFGAEYGYKNQNAALGGINDYMGNIINRDRNENSFYVDNYGLQQKDQEIANDQTYRERQMQSMDAEDAYTQARTAALQAEMAGYGAAAGGSGGSGSGGYYSSSGDNEDEGEPKDSYSYNSYSGSQYTAADATENSLHASDLYNRYYQALTRSQTLSNGGDTIANIKKKMDDSYHAGNLSSTEYNRLLSLANASLG